MEADIIRQFI